MLSTVEGWQATVSRVHAAAIAAGRKPEEVGILAVSKTFPLEAVIEAVHAGARAFGENYVQEGVSKVLAAASRPELPPLEWHFIGPLQSNKSREVAEHFQWAHGIDRLKIAQRLSDQRPAHLAPLQVCVQVNVSGEDTKSGVAPGEVSALAHAVAKLPGLRLRGLMAIPAPTDNPVLQRTAFSAVRELLQDLIRQGLRLDTLSMGMSADLEAAIAEGATLVRVGTAIFGQRGVVPDPTAGIV
jgi:pyridoxal phosphate enzyme (YggS family)